MIKVRCQQHKTDESTFIFTDLDQLVAETGFGRSSVAGARAVSGGSTSGTGTGSSAAGAAGV
ncbi:hypothetical protein [Vibrio penaeicida]|uniref:Uncharacterized protein n=1 Tax=Vibrio penaeicida TaxID=104609 RepID=A0AAV5NZ26_9VIBR|nr:hypothetical protein [Vibrio penaeicida]RTZ24000.1 hypothetical protein EKN09_05970 [Vibrio penaeicida]GLQ75926.1 hypothetical protein GCM10007932_52890 [Vibrio penaeicida]